MRNVGKNGWNLFPAAEREADAETLESYSREAETGNITTAGSCHPMLILTRHSQHTPSPPSYSLTQVDTW